MRRTGLVALLVLAALPLCGAAASGTPPGARLPSVSASAYRTIALAYLDGLGETQVSVRLAPQGSHGVPIPADLVFIAVYRGDVTAPDTTLGPPAELYLQAQASPLVFHVSLEFTVRVGARTVNLLGPGAWSGGAACGRCGLTVVRARLDPHLLVALSQSATITADVLGMTGELGHADVVAIGDFAARVGLAARP